MTCRLFWKRFWYFASGLLMAYTCGTEAPPRWWMRPPRWWHSEEYYSWELAWFIAVEGLSFEEICHGVPGTEGRE